MRLYGRGGQGIIWLAKGDARMLVPGVAAGGGVGLSVLNSGWMCASLTAGLGGRDVSGTILGGGERACASVSSESSGNGPSRARAGDAGRLPGIGSKAVPREGADCMTASLACGSTLLVSHASKPSDWDVLSIEWLPSEYILRASLLKDGRLMSFVREVTGRTT